MSFELGENQLSTLGLIVGYNKSDSTYGWNGYLGGMTLFYSHIFDDVVEGISLTANRSLPTNNRLTKLDRDSFDTADGRFNPCRFSTEHSKDLLGQAVYRLYKN